MSEHQHEWTVDHQIIPETSPTGIPIGECFAYCGCGAELRWNEVTDIINAHADLKAKLEMVEQHQLMLVLQSRMESLENLKTSKRRPNPDMALLS